MTDIVAGQLPEPGTVRIHDADLVGGCNAIHLTREDDFPGQLIGWRRRRNRILRDGSEGRRCKTEIGRRDLLRRGGRGKAGGRGGLKRGEQVRRRG